MRENEQKIFTDICKPPIRHVDKDMDVTYKNVLVYGRRPDADCNEHNTDVNPTAKLTGIGYHTPEQG